jgi:hypothetical protein
LLWLKYPRCYQGITEKSADTGSAGLCRSDFEDSRYQQCPYLDLERFSDTKADIKEYLSTHIIVEHTVSEHMVPEHRFAVAQSTIIAATSKYLCIFFYGK